MLLILLGLRVGRLLFFQYIFTCFAEKIEYSTRYEVSESKTKFCQGTIVRIDSELVFQTNEDFRMIFVSYKKKNRDLFEDYVSSQKVVPSEVTPGKTVLFYADEYDCLFKGKVTSVNKQDKTYTIDGKQRKESAVRYFKGDGEVVLYPHNDSNYER